MLYITNDVYSCSIGAFLYKHFVLPLVPHYFKYCIYTTAKKKRPNQLGYLVGIWL